jgi:DNA-binding GntR family transcriptional regulator
MPEAPSGTERDGVPEIHRDRLADQAYEVLRQRILSRRLKAGERLSVPLLAQELGLSRSPVREAVQRLVSDGLGSERPRQGAFVASADPTQLSHLYHVRAALEGLSAALATTAGDPGLVPALQESTGHQAAAFAAGDEVAIIRSDIAFHSRLLSAAANPELTRALDPILGRVAVAMLAGDLESWPARALREHEEIIAAVASGDAELARRRSEEHVLQVRERLLRKLTAAVPAGEDPR